jgi:hypothetical protein
LALAAYSKRQKLGVTFRVTIEKRIGAVCSTLNPSTVSTDG